MNHKDVRFTRLSLTYLAAPAACYYVLPRKPTKSRQPQQVVSDVVLAALRQVEAQLSRAPALSGRATG
jgi:hypothetical protein